MPAPPGPEPESDPLLRQETFLRWDEGAGEGREGDRRVQCAGDQREGEAQGGNWDCDLAKSRGIFYFKITYCLSLNIHIFILML